MPSTSRRRPKGASRPTHCLWLHRQQRCLEAIRAGEDVEVVPTSYGGNDFILEFLMGSGLWSILTDMEPDELKKENGAPWRALNGVEVIRELARVDRIAHVGKILADTRLMLLAGFNAEQVSQASRRGRFVIDPETLANHLDRISPRSAQRAFLEHLRLMRRRRWIRGQVYAADAHEIIVPYGRAAARLGRVGEKYGYKLVVLLNVTPERERVVGFVLAPLPCSERTLLRILLRGLERGIGPVRTWMKVLVLDRGYWGARLLLGIKKKYGVDVVTRMQHEELDVVKDIEGLLALAPPGSWVRSREQRSRLGEIEVRCTGLEDLVLRDGDGKEVGTIQAVVADEFDLQGRPLRDPVSGEERGRWYYATTLPVKRNPMRVRVYYLSRWVIENQGFRELTQRWALDILAGRRFNLIHARIAFTLMLYNADHVLRMKFPGPWEQERERLKGLGVKSSLQGPALAAYTGDGALGLLQADEFAEAIRQNEQQRWIRRLADAARAGESLQDILGRLTAPG